VARYTPQCSSESECPDIDIVGGIRAVGPTNSPMDEDVKSKQHPGQGSKVRTTSKNRQLRAHSVYNCSKCLSNASLSGRKTHVLVTCSTLAIGLDREEDFKCKNQTLQF
jgi:hypothetical protein